MFPLRGRIVRFWTVLARTPRRATAVALVGLLLTVAVATGAALLMGGSAATPSEPVVDAPQSAVVSGTNGTGALTTSGTPLLLELRSTGNATVAYQFDVEGTVEKTSIGESDVAADPEDELAVQDDGTTMVNGSIGEDGGDAYVVNGTIASSNVTNASDMVVLLTANVTAQFVNGSDGGPGDGSGDGEDDGSKGTTGDDGGIGDDGDVGGDDDGGDAGGDDGIGDDDSNGAAGGNEGNGDDGPDAGGDDEGDNDGSDIGNGDDDGDEGNGDDSIQTIDSCTVIDEPGSYELASDIGDGTTTTDFDIVGNAPTCLHVNESDVVIDGNGHAVVNDGDRSDAIGIYVVADPPTSVPGNVTVRNVAVQGWSEGISAGWHMGDAVGSEVRIENVEASDNDMGVSLNGPSDSTVVDSTVRGNTYGLRIRELTNVRISDVEAHDNAEAGISLGQGAVGNEISDVSVRDNGGRGISMGSTGIIDNTISDATIGNNGDAGVAIYGDASGNRIVGSTIESNEDTGVRVGETSGTSNVAIRETQIRDNGADAMHFVSGTEDSRLTSVTVSGHDGASLRTDEGALDGSEFRLADAWSFDFAGEGVTLSPIAQDDLPALPDGQTPLQDGVDVAGVEDRVMATFDVTGSVGTDTEVQLVRHDGTEWSSVATFETDELAGGVQQELTEDGAYAVVEVDGTPTDTTTETPTDTPTETPTEMPTDTPTEIPTDTPTEIPTDTPMETPTDTPTEAPTDTPTEAPTDTPTEAPTDAPTEAPTDAPTETPIDTPSETPPEAPTDTQT